MATAKPTLPPPPPPLPPSHHPSRAMKMSSMNKDVMQILSGKQDRRSATLPPIVPAFPVPKPESTITETAKRTSMTEANTTAPSSNNTNTTNNNNKPETKVKVGNRIISSSKPARKWVWAPFTSSARSDGAQFRHWVRAGVEYPDYPYARFDIHLDPVTYTDEEYRRFLQHKTWTKSETDKLLGLCQRLELRWAVIYDRWCDYAMKTETKNARRIEDLQHRYYSVAARILQARVSKEAAAEVAALSAVDNKQTMDTAAARAIATAEPQHQPLIANIGTGTTNKELFDLNRERERRAYQDMLWNRTKAEELEEAALKKELALVEAQLKKLKKSGAHILAADAPSRAVSPVVDTAAMLNKSFASTAPTPMPGTPYLQSGRLVPPATGGQGGLNKSTLKRMDAILEELKVPKKPSVPSKRICDLFDSVRKDALTLFSLQKITMQKEGQLQAKRLRLAKMGGGGRVVEEETLLGIAPTPTPVVTTSSVPRTKAKPKARVNTGGKGKATGGKAAPTTKAPESDPTGKGVRKTAGTKRKKKTEPKTTATTPPPASTGPTPTVAAPKDLPVPVPLPSVRADTEDTKQSKKRVRKS